MQRLIGKKLSTLNFIYMFFLKSHDNKDYMLKLLYIYCFDIKISKEINY